MSECVWRYFSLTTRRVVLKELSRKKIFQRLALLGLSMMRSLIPDLQDRASVLLSSIQDHGYSISGKMVDEICNSIDPFEIQHSSYEDLAVLIRTSLVLGLFAFPGLEHNLPKIRQDFSNAFSNEKYASNTVKDLKQSLLDNFWSQQYPSILVGINSLKGDRNNLIIKQMTHNLQKLGT